MPRTTATSELARRQQVLRDQYRSDPEAAITIKHVRSRPDAAPDPVHGAVEAIGAVPTTRWAFGTDAKIGGLDDLPNSGHLLCAALAACEDNTIRMIADHLGVQIEHLVVDVVGDVDCRGCLAMDRDVPVGFRSLEMHVDLVVAPETEPRFVAMLEAAAERLCVNLDTLRRGVPVSITYTSTGRSTS